MSRSKISIPARRVPQIQRPSVGPRDLVVMVSELAQPQAGAARQWPLIASTACSCCPRCMGSVAGPLLGWLSRPLIGGSPVTRARWCVWMHLSPLPKATLPFAAPEWPPYEAQSRSHMGAEDASVLRPGIHVSMPPLISPRLSPHSVPFSRPSLLVLPRPMSRTCPWHPRRRRELPHQPEPS